VEPKIDRADLPEIVEEAARLSEAEHEGLAAGEARQILRELDLPEGRLEEARLAVEARKRERARRLRALTTWAAVLGVVAAVAIAFTAHEHSQSLALGAMTASEASLSLRGSPLSAPVPRSSSPELTFDVVLARAPHAPVDLSCDWAGPDGAVRFQSRWETKSVDRDLWPTHCRHVFSASEPAGAWTVSMKERERVLATKPFVLQ
jgi:hypothetical protein